MWTNIDLTRKTLPSWSSLVHSLAPGPYTITGQVTKPLQLKLALPALPHASLLSLTLKACPDPRLGALT